MECGFYMSGTHLVSRFCVNPDDWIAARTDFWSGRRTCLGRWKTRSTWVFLYLRVESTMNLWTSRISIYIYVYIYLQICTWLRAQIGRCFSYKAIPSNPKRWVPTGVSRSFQLNKRWLNRSFGRVAPLDGKELYWDQRGQRSTQLQVVRWSICCGHFCGVWDLGHVRISNWVTVKSRV